MTGQEYIAEVLRTYAGKQILSEKLTLGALGLAGETGEVVDQIKKFLYQGHPLDQERLCDELGDVLWYFTLIAEAMGCSLEEIMIRNVEKLRKRYPDGFDESRSRDR